MRRIVVHCSIILSVAGLVLFTNLGAAKLWDRDEPRNAGCAREMMTRGDLVTPIFNDELRDAKPVFLYWLIMSAYTVFGESEFAARFWSAALAVGTVLATYAIGRRLFNARVALWSAIILATSLMFDVAGRAATPDSALIFFVTLAMMIFVLGTFKPKSPGGEEYAPALRTPEKYFPRSWLVVALMYGVMGLAVLTKGPVGLVVPTAVIGMFLLLVRLPPREPTETVAEPGWIGFTKAKLGSCLRPFSPRHFLRTCWHMRPLTALIVIAVIAAPWFIVVGLRTDGDYLRGFFVKEHFGRATTAMENHSGSILFYPTAILVGFFPWSVFAIPVIIGVVRRIRQADPWKLCYLFAACWIYVFVGVFSMAKTKLPSYVTPCYPALALLTGCFLYRWSCAKSVVPRVWPWLSMVALAMVGTALLICIPLAAGRFVPGSEWLGAIGVIPLLGAIVCVALMVRRRLQFAGVAFTGMAVLFAASLFGFATVEVDKHQQNTLLFEEIAERSSNPQIGSYGCLESSWVFYARRPIWELSSNYDEHEAATNRLDSRAKSWKPKPRPGVESFFATAADPFVITTKERLASLKSKLPNDVEVLAEVPYFLQDQQLILLGRRRFVETAQQRKSRPRSH